MKEFFTSIKQGHKQFTRFRWQMKLRVQDAMGWFGRFLRPVMTLAVFALGFSVVYIVVTLRDDPKARRVFEQRVVEQAKAWNLDTYGKKLKKLSQLTTRNAKYTVLRNNMERLRLMLEAYPVEGMGYPPDVATLYNHARAGKYWKLYKNPISGATEPYTAIISNYSYYEYAWEHRPFKGTVLYQREGPGYRIYVCDEEGELVTNLNGIFSVSNLDD